MALNPPSPCWDPCNFGLQHCSEIATQKCSFCLLHAALRIEKEKTSGKKTETSCIVGADLNQGPRAALGRERFLNAYGKFSERGCCSRGRGPWKG